jgi:hypothetical protein
MNKEVIIQTALYLSKTSDPDGSLVKFIDKRGFGMVSPQNMIIKEYLVILHVFSLFYLDEINRNVILRGLNLNFDWNVGHSLSVGGLYVFSVSLVHAFLSRSLERPLQSTLF